MLLTSPDSPSNPEPMRNPIYRLISRWTLFSPPLKIVTLILFFSLCLTSIYFTLQMTGQIAFINGKPTPTYPITPPITPPYDPRPSVVPVNCVIGVTTASVIGACSTQGFYLVKFECANGKSVTLGDGKTCFDLYSAAEQARSTCGNICTPYSPRPSFRPSPKSSFVPQPSLSPLPSPSIFPSSFPTMSPVPSPTPAQPYMTCLYKCIFKNRGNLSVCQTQCSR